MLEIIVVKKSSYYYILEAIVFVAIILGGVRVIPTSLAILSANNCILPLVGHIGQLHAYILYNWSRRMNCNWDQK